MNWNLITKTTEISIAQLKYEPIQYYFVSFVLISLSDAINRFKLIYFKLILLLNRINVVVNYINNWNILLSVRNTLGFWNTFIPVVSVCCIKEANIAGSPQITFGACSILANPGNFVSYLVLSRFTIYVGIEASVDISALIFFKLYTYVNKKTWFYLRL